MRVSKHIPHLPWQLLQQLGGEHLVGITGDGARRGSGEPDATDGDGPMQLPAVPPAVIPGLAPRGFGVNRGMGDFPGQSMFLVPDAAVGAPGRTVDSRRVALGCPRPQQRDQMAPQTSNQCGQPRWQFLKAPFPGALWEKRPC